MVDSVRVWRRYQIVSACGTHGTCLQQLLAFTTARTKAPQGALDSALQRYHIDLCVLIDDYAPAAQLDGGCCASGG